MMLVKWASRALLWLFLPVAVMCAGALALRPTEWAPSHHAAERQLRVFAFRQWQSTGVRVRAGDRLSLRAEGEWAYSPWIGLNGPAGGSEFSPPSYPLPRAWGGALLGRIGENGAPFYIGPRLQLTADGDGLLFMRINDDLLGDNNGYLNVQVAVATPVAAP